MSGERGTYGLSVTNAYTACPVSSSADPITAAQAKPNQIDDQHRGTARAIKRDAPAVSATPACNISADSISAVDSR